jgi:hypothetical protein
MQKRTCQGATRNPNRNETNMTNDSKVLPHKPNSRPLRIVRATMGVMTLVVLTFPFVQAKGNAETGPGLLLAVNQGEATLGIVDPQAGKQVATIAEGGVTGHEVAVSLDGKTAYVPIYGDSSVGEAGTDGRDMVAIDIASRKVVGHLDFGQPISRRRRDGWIS